MHIARIRHIFYPDMPRDYFYELSVEQSRVGNVVDLITWRKKGSLSKLSSDGFTIHRIKGVNIVPMGITRDYPYLPTIFSKIKSLRPDVVHAESHLFLPTIQAINAAKKLSLPSVTTVHGVYAERGRIANALQIAYIRTLSLDIFRKTHAVVCLTKTDAYEIAKLGCPRKKLHIIPNGINTNLFSPGKTAETILIVWSGRFVKEKGLELLIEAAALAAKKTTAEIRFLLIGYGPLKGEIIRLIRHYKLDDYFSVIGPLNREEIARVLKIATIFVFPSLREGFPISVLEALSSGLPIVGFNVPGVKDLVENNKNGLLLPVGNCELFSEALVYLINNEEIRLKMGRESRKKAIESYDLDAIVKKINALYEKISSDNLYHFEQGAS